MLVSAQQIFKNLASDQWRPFYLIVGEEPFQTDEIISKLKQYFVKDDVSGAFNLEVWDGEHIDAGALLGSLDTLPGLFDVGNDSRRLVICHRFEKISAANIEILLPYFKNPSDTTCFLMCAQKADKRKAWYKSVDEKGEIVEVTEPYDREWPKWHAYFEKKIGKKIAADGWEPLVEHSQRKLSLLWAELQKLATYVGSRPSIHNKDLVSMGVSPSGVDVFSLAEDVLLRRAYSSMRKFHHLVLNGESEIKILSILVRQFRLVERCLQLQKKGITDTKLLGTQLGTHPFFVPKLLRQAQVQSETSLGSAIRQLAECDFSLKTGEGKLLEGFLIPYFSRSETPQKTV